MQGLSRLPCLLLACAAFGAQAAVIVEVPGPQAIQTAVTGTSARDRLARQSATAFVLANLVRVQVGKDPPTAAQSARIAELEAFRTKLDADNETILPVACRGRDCEERYAFNRCLSAYQFSPSFYRAVYDRFIGATAQKSLTPRLSSGAGTVWQEAAAMPAGSQPLDRLAPPSRECNGGGAGVTTTAQAAAGKPNLHDESLRRARAAGVDTTVLGLKLGEPVNLPLCPQQGLFDSVFSQGVAQTCLRSDDELAGLIVEMATAMTGQSYESAYELTIVMPNAKCPDWVSGCSISGHQVDGKLVAVMILTKGLDVQDDVAMALMKKYKAWTTKGTYHWKNDVTGDMVDSHDMTWKLAGINVHFRGYTGGQRDGVGSILVETDATTRERDAAEKARQAEKQQL